MASVRVNEQTYGPTDVNTDQVAYMRPNPGDEDLRVIVMNNGHELVVPAQDARYLNTIHNLEHGFDTDDGEVLHKIRQCHL